MESAKENANSPYDFLEVFYQCVTPLHVGCGQDVGIVDLPVIRERTTGYPFIPGSGIRGSLRERCEFHEASEQVPPAEQNPAEVESEGDGAKAKQAKTPAIATVRLFGSETPGDLSAGCVSVIDAHLLLFPVRSAPGPCRWITCPFVVERYNREREYFIGRPSKIGLPGKLPKEGFCVGIHPGGEGSGKGDDGRGSKSAEIYLEEFPYSRSFDPSWKVPISLPGLDGGDILLLPDEDFFYFARYATIVMQRNRLSSVKTVVGGQLFSVESVPPEAVFYGFVGVTGERSKEQRRWSKAQVKEQWMRLAKDRSGDSTDGGGGGASDAGSETSDSAPTDSANGEAHECHLVLGGDESTGLGLTRLTWRA